MLDARSHLYGIWVFGCKKCSFLLGYCCLFCGVVCVSRDDVVLVINGAKAEDARGPSDVSLELIAGN